MEGVHIKYKLTVKFFFLNFISIRSWCHFCVDGKHMESTQRLISVKKDSTVNSFDGPNNNLASPPGTIFTISCNNGREFLYVKTLRHDNRPHWNKWIIIFDIYGGEPKIPY